MSLAMLQLKDPVKLIKFLWPEITLYSQQKDILYSLIDNDETFVPAGNMLGKDFIAALAVLCFFLTRTPCRVVTTSVDHTQLSAVLWGEIRRFIQTSKYPLSVSRGGPILVNDLHLRKMVNGQIDGLSYVVGRVAAKGEGMLGHHIADLGDGIPRTLFVSDEASGVDDESYERADTWAKRKLVIGNPYPCENFFKKGVKQGDLKSLDGKRCYRKVIKITGHDSPNVRYAQAQIQKGMTPTEEVIIPGVLPYSEYKKRMETWDPIRRSIGIDAQFYEGSDLLLYPPMWLNLAEERHRQITIKSRKAKAIGIDPAEGGDKTAMAAVDEFGLIELLSRKTPDTSMITAEALAFMRKHGVEPENVVFDRGGGGKQHADRLRQQGYPVRTVAFGESVVPDPKRGTTPIAERKDQIEDRYTYKNRRAEMYGELRELLDPGLAGIRFALPAEYTELRNQLSVMPLLYDPEGRIRMLPKNSRDKDSDEPTLTKLIGHSPDEADALVVAIHGMLHKAKRQTAGAF